MAVRHYQQLIAWQKAMDLVELTYRATRTFPREEVYGLSSQMRRAAVSIPSNIAEGQGRGGSKDFVRYLRIANGSRQELETQVLIASRMGFVNESYLDSLLAGSAEVGRLLRGLARSLAE